MNWIPFIVVPLFLFVILKPVYDNYKSTDGIVNTDVFSREFVFKADKSREEIVRLLSVTNEYDEPQGIYNAKSETLTLSGLGATIKYKIAITEKEGYCIIRVKQITIIHRRSNLPYHLNRFIIRKLGAEPIPFFEDVPE